MPALKSSQALGALPSLGSGSGRSILETETLAITQSTDQMQSFSNSEREGTTGVPEAFIAMDSGARRGRNNFPMEIVEVKQDELMKNRRIVDQVKSVGIAFRPAHQPESSSSKGKVSNLHKRKHQITALFMDMKHKESELSERCSKGLFSLKLRHAKYGW